jgi:hypothetical protein
MRPVLRRGGRVAEGAPLLREYTSKGCRGFESPLLRHYLARLAQARLANKPEVIWSKNTNGLIAQLDRVLGYEPSGRRFESS